MSTIANNRKVAIIGCGFVGSASAFALMESGLFSEMVLIDVDADRAEGEALDISHGTAFASPIDIYAGTYDDIADAGIVIITAGVGQKPGKRASTWSRKTSPSSRASWARFAREFAGILLVVSNPVDILTYVSVKLSGLPEKPRHGLGHRARHGPPQAHHRRAARSRSAQRPRPHPRRARRQRADRLVERARGGHSRWKTSTTCASATAPYEEFRRETSDLVKNSAYEIIEKKNATYYGIAMAIKRICGAVVRDEKSVLSVSNYMQGEYGISDIALSTPCVVGANGIEVRMPPSLNYREQEQMKASAQTLQDVAAGLDLG